jgi:hypothetical protein
MRVRIEWIGVLPALRMGCAFSAFMALLVAIPALLCVFSSGFIPVFSREMEAIQALGMQAAIFNILVGGIVATFFGGIGWMLFALIYNFLADLFGGVEVGMMRMRMVEVVRDVEDTNRHETDPRSDAVRAWSRENAPRPKERKL